MKDIRETQKRKAARPLTEKQKREIEEAVKKVVREYGETLRMFGQDREDQESG